MSAAIVERCAYCHHPIAADRIRAYVMYPDGALWAVYARCPRHGVEPVEVMYDPQIEKPALVLAGDSRANERSL